MSQKQAWEKEYQEQRLLTNSLVPQKDVGRFSKFLKKEKFDIENATVLDLGSGIGKNSLYFAERGAKVIGFEISQNALAIAKREAGHTNITYKSQDIGKSYSLDDDSIDIIIDVLSSNSLDKKGRKIYLKEISRVLKQNGYLFVKALCKDGDRHAQYLLKHNPGFEENTYVMKDTDIIEYVFIRNDFIKTYSKYFNIVFLKKKTSYTKMNNRSFKRNFWLGYMKLL